LLITSKEAKTRFLTFTNVNYYLEAEELREKKHSSLREIDKGQTTPDREK